MDCRKAGNANVGRLREVWQYKSIPCSVLVCYGNAVFMVCVLLTCAILFGEDCDGYLQSEYVRGRRFWDMRVPSAACWEIPSFTAVVNVLGASVDATWSLLRGACCRSGVVVGVVGRPVSRTLGRDCKQREKQQKEAARVCPTSNTTAAAATTTAVAVTSCALLFGSGNCPRGQAVRAGGRGLDCASAVPEPRPESRKMVRRRVYSGTMAQVRHRRTATGDHHQTRLRVMVPQLDVNRSLVSTTRTRSCCS